MFFASSLTIFVQFFQIIFLEIYFHCFLLSYCKHTNKKIKRLNKKYFIIDFSKNNKFKKDRNSHSISIGQFGKIISILKKNKKIYILSDDIYEHITYDNFEFSTIAEIKELKDRTLTMNGVSKSYSMTGWRIGYAAGPVEILSLIHI